ncbi:MAG: gluconolactonase [Humisphaera sp.]|nr:gluconolactonase [Humisphaera sp.]
MTTNALLTLLVMTCAAAAVHAADSDERFKQLVPPDAKPEKIAGGMKFIEGPVWTSGDGAGYLVFSDIPASQLNRWDDKTGVQTFRDESHQTNGNTRDREGRLISCEHAARRVTRTEKDGSVIVLVDRFDGKKFNSPNDPVVKSDGSIWFTDPTYGTPAGEAKEIDGRYVYRFEPESKSIAKVAEGFDQPNGLCFSPDEKRLYVADSGKPHNIRAFDVKADGTLSGGDVLCVIDHGAPDGIRCDEHGNIWSSAGDGVHVFAPDGKLLGKIPVPESPANLCFGGADGKTLFITARTSLYSIKTNVRGASRKDDKVTR